MIEKGQERGREKKEEESGDGGSDRLEIHHAERRGWEKRDAEENIDIRVEWQP